MVVSKPRGWVQEDVQRDFNVINGIFYWKTGPRVNKIAGWNDKFNYQNVRYKGQLVKVHNLAMLFYHGSWPTKEVDHKDNNPQNNSIDNLRESDRNGQGMNQKLQIRRAGKYKGVHKSTSGKFYIKIKHLGVQHYYGTYENEQEAAMIYNTHAEKLFGEFAHYNKVFEDIKDEND